MVLAADLEEDERRRLTETEGGMVEEDAAEEDDDVAEEDDGIWCIEKGMARAVSSFRTIPNEYTSDAEVYCCSRGTTE